MRNLATVLLLFFLFAAATPPSTAEIKSKKIRSDDRSEIRFDYFTFTNSGHVSIAVSSVSVDFLPVTSNISRPDPSRFGFFLLSEEAKRRYYIERISCSLDSKFISLILTFPNTSLHTFNESYPVTYPNDYSLYFANCNPLTHVSMDVRTELYNMDDNGRTKNYLAAGMTKLPRLYFIFSRIYFCFLAIWIFICFINRTYVHSVHLLMDVLLVSKAINLLCAFEVQESVKVTGVHSHKWDNLFYIFHFTTNSLLYTVIAVIFDGWTGLRSNSKMFLMIVIPLQFWSTMLFKENGVIGFESSHSGFGIMVDMLLGFVIIAPVFLSLSDVWEINEEGRKYLAKCDRFWCFLILVCVYLFFNLILGGINKKSYEYHWKSNEAEEIMILVFYILMFVMFRPFEIHRYFIRRQACMGDEKV